MNTNKLGDKGLGKAIAFFAGEGLTVCIPMTDSQHYDLIVDAKDGLDRVQVKYTNQRKSATRSYSASLRTQTRSATKKLNKNAVDSLFLVTPVSLYWIPVQVLESDSYIFLTKKWDPFLVELRA